MEAGRTSLGLSLEALEMAAKSQTLLRIAKSLGRAQLSVLQRSQQRQLSITIWFSEEPRCLELVPATLPKSNCIQSQFDMIMIASATVT